MTRTHGRTRAARHDPTAGGDPFPEIVFDPDDPDPAAREQVASGGPWILEIGTGNGVFLAAQAVAHPDQRFLGVERDAEFFYKMKKRLLREGLTNVRCIRADVEDVLDRLIGSGELSEVILNFSDPWPKRRHRERRVFGPAFLERIERALVPDGKLHFQTDVGWYFNLAVADLRRRDGWSLTGAGPVEAGGLETNFERKGRDQGRSIWAFSASFRGDAPGVPPS
jgi:tRNA (guanine-N7-)-methyltransferase